MHTVYPNSSPIKSVTVFRDRAVVTRKVSFTPSSVGEEQICLSGLCSLVEESVSIEVVKGAVELKDTHTTREMANNIIQREDDDREDLETLIKKLDDLRWKHEEYIQKQKTLNEQEGFIRSFSSTFFGQPLCPQPSPCGDHQAPHMTVNLSCADVDGALKREKDKLHEVSMKKLQIQKDMEVLQDETAIILMKLKQWDNRVVLNQEDTISANNHIASIFKNASSAASRKVQPIRRVWDICMSFDVTAVEEAELEVTYTTVMASWSPAYDLHVQADSVNVVYSGMVKQQTDEVWKGVRLSLSTGHSLGRLAVPPPLPTKLASFADPKAPRPPVAANAFTKSARAMGAGGSLFGAAPQAEMMMDAQCAQPPPPL
eukprot:GHVO01040294.1.p1 GENE.GHVO01040294.1~~GHVO01040294.1.p1  ORF type:complete len:372 (-),score=83.42 GHVO01040294.1:41-1156(-)